MRCAGWPDAHARGASAPAAPDTQRVARSRADIALEPREWSVEVERMEHKLEYRVLGLINSKTEEKVE